MEMATIFEPSQVLIKRQQPVASGLGVASFADQNSGLSVKNSRFIQFQEF